MAQYPVGAPWLNRNSAKFPAGQFPRHPGDEMVTLEDGREYPIKKTICVPHGNLLCPPGPRVKRTAKLTEEEEMNEDFLRKHCAEGNLNNVKELIAEGVNVNARARAAGATPMICAAVKGKLDAMKLLWEAGADPHLANGQLSTPILCAAQWNHIDVVRFLLEECNVDPRQWDNMPSPQCPIHHARDLENKDMEELIAKYWMKYQAVEDKKKESAEKKEKREKDRHRQEVSAARAAARAAAAVSVS